MSSASLSCATPLAAECTKESSGHHLDVSVLNSSFRHQRSNNGSLYALLGARNGIEPHGPAYTRSILRRSPTLSGEVYSRAFAALMESATDKYLDAMRQADLSTLHHIFSTTSHQLRQCQLHLRGQHRQ